MRFIQTASLVALAAMADQDMAKTKSHAPAPPKQPKGFDDSMAQTISQHDMDKVIKAEEKRKRKARKRAEIAARQK